jgi:hypothetical protein
VARQSRFHRIHDADTHAGSSQVREDGSSAGSG